jgi:hypothetical protein
VKQILFENVDKFYARHKGVNRTVFQKNIFVELADGAQDEVNEEEKALCDVVWLSREEMKKELNLVNHRAIFEKHIQGDSAFCEK